MSTGIRLSLEEHGSVEQAKQRWSGALPLDMIIIEYQGTGDPFFGGRADDRPMLANGEIRHPGPDGRFSYEYQCAVFGSIEEAHAAAKTIPNRRAGSLLGVAPRWR